MIDHLIFDTSSFTTIDDTHSVGAYVRSGQSGALISHHSAPEAGSISFVFVDADVTPGTDTIVEAAHGLVTGDRIRLTSSGTLPAGLALATDYYVIRLDSGSFKLAASPKDAERGIAVDITAAAGGGNHTLTEQENDRRALDVWMVNPIDVNITQADEITVFQGTDPWVIGDGGGSITVDGTVELGATTLAALENITVSATDLDIRDLAFATDKVDVSGSTVELGATTLAALETITVNQGTSPWVIGDGGGSITVDAVDLDVRDLTHVSDSVRLGDGTSFFTSTTVGGDIGLDVYQINDPAVANTAIASNINTLGAANTAEDVVASPLANRKLLMIYNNDNQKMYIGQSGVSAANGFPLSPGAYLELRAGASIDIEWVSAKSGHDMRHLELA
jgi:hypothetical protein